MLVAGNWKMNLDLVAARQLASALRSAVSGLDGVGPSGRVDVAVCPPFVNIDALYGILHGSGIKIGAQNMHAAESGAYTGEISASMLRAVGCHYVILGHSERREYFGETDAGVQEKAIQAMNHRMVPIVCVGERLDDRDGGREEAVVGEQLKEGLKEMSLSGSRELVIAYEPVWAIGTGRTASPEQAQAMHAFIRSHLVSQFGEAIGGGVDILYGGSMKPDNAAELLAQPDVNGGLIGGAALKADAFVAIIKAAAEAEAA